MTFGRGCFGNLRFFKGGLLSGVFMNLFPETVAFEGKRRSGPHWCGRSAYSFQQEWDEYVTEAYGRS